MHTQKITDYNYADATKNTDYLIDLMKRPDKRNFFDALETLKKTPELGVDFFKLMNFCINDLDDIHLASNIVHLFPQAIRMPIIDPHNETENPFSLLFFAVQKNNPELFQWFIQNSLEQNTLSAEEIKALLLNFPKRISSSSWLAQLDVLYKQHNIYNKHVFYDILFKTLNLSENKSDQKALSHIINHDHQQLMELNQKEFLEKLNDPDQNAQYVDALTHPSSDHDSMLRKAVKDNDPECFQIILKYLLDHHVSNKTIQYLVTRHLPKPSANWLIDFYESLQIEDLSYLFSKNPVNATLPAAQRKNVFIQILLKNMEFSEEMKPTLVQRSLFLDFFVSLPDELVSSILNDHTISFNAKQLVCLLQLAHNNSNYFDIFIKRIKTFSKDEQHEFCREVLALFAENPVAFSSHLSLFIAIAQQCSVDIHDVEMDIKSKLIAFQCLLRRAAVDCIENRPESLLFFIEKIKTHSLYTNNHDYFSELLQIDVIDYLLDKRQWNLMMMVFDQVNSTLDLDYPNPTQLFIRSIQNKNWDTAKYIMYKLSQLHDAVNQFILDEKNNIFQTIFSSALSDDQKRTAVRLVLEEPVFKQACKKNSEKMYTLLKSMSGKTSLDDLIAEFKPASASPSSTAAPHPDLLFSTTSSNSSSRKNAQGLLSLGLGRKKK